MPTSAVSPRLRAMSRSMFAALVFVVVVSCSVLWAHDAHADSTSDLVSLTNSARASHGLAALTASGDLAAVARAQAGRMAASHTLAHTPNLTTAVCCWSAIGENVGEGASATVLQSAFMASPEHRANILSTAYSQVGIGVAVDAQGTLWVSEIFRGPSDAAAKPAPKPQPAVTHAPTHAPVPTKVKAPPTTTGSVRTPVQQPKVSVAIAATPPIPTPPPAATNRASRDLPGGRLSLDAAHRFAANIASFVTAGSPDPVSRMLDFATTTARSS